MVFSIQNGRNRIPTRFLSTVVCVGLGFGLFIVPSFAQDSEKVTKLDIDRDKPVRTEFEVDGRKAFVWEPAVSKRVSGKMPWVWYAPTFVPRLPGPEEHWMIERFHQQGIAIAGIDVGESFGSPEGTGFFQAFYEHVTRERGYSSKPVLLARSRGGLMLYNWAVEHPESVAAVAGIYPVCNLSSYPKIPNAAPAYKLSAKELESRLQEFNPVDRIEPLAKRKVPVLHIHGDQDKVVPLEENSAQLAKRYRAARGPAIVEVIPGQGHNMWQGWFRSPLIIDFVICHARGKKFDLEASREKTANKAADK